MSRTKETNPPHCVLGISPEEKIKVTFIPPTPLHPTPAAPTHSLPSPLVQLEEGWGGFSKCGVSICLFFFVCGGAMCVQRMYVYVFMCRAVIAADHQHIFSHDMVLSLNLGLTR